MNQKYIKTFFDCGWRQWWIQDFVWPGRQFPTRLRFEKCVCQSEFLKEYHTWVFGSCITGPRPLSSSSIVLSITHGLLLSFHCLSTCIKSIKTFRLDCIRQCHSRSQFEITSDTLSRLQFFLWVQKGEISDKSLFSMDSHVHQIVNFNKATAVSS